MPEGCFINEIRDKYFPSSDNKQAKYMLSEFKCSIKCGMNLKVIVIDDRMPMIENNRGRSLPAPDFQAVYTFICSD